MSVASDFGRGLRAQAADPRPPPHDEAVERSVIGCVLIGGRSALEAAREHVSASDFYATPHQLLWGIIDRLHGDGSALDPVTIRDAVCRNGVEARIGGEAYLARLAREVPSDSAVADYARAVKRYSVARVVVASCRSLGELARDPARLDDLPSLVSEEMGTLREVLAEATAGKTKGDEMPSAADLVARNLEPREWLVEGLAQRAKTVIVFGSSYAGKSVLTTQLLLALARGDNYFLGFRLPGRPVEVGYFMGENDEYELADTLRAQSGGDPPRTFRYVDVFARPDRKPLGTPEGLAWYRATIIRNNLAVAAIDNLMSLVGEDLKDTETAVRTMEGMKRVSKETGVTWFPLAHTRKEGSKGDDGGFMDRLYGAHEWGSYADAALHVAYPKDSSRDDPTREIHVAKVRGARPRPGFLVEMERESLTARFVAELGGTPKQKPSMKPEVVLDYIRNHRPVVTVHEIVEAFGVHRATVYRLLDSDQWRALIADGTIRVAAHGRRGGPSAFECRK